MSAQKPNRSVEENKRRSMKRRTTYATRNELEAAVMRRVCDEIAKRMGCAVDSARAVMMIGKARAAVRPHVAYTKAYKGDELRDGAEATISHVSDIRARCSSGTWDAPGTWDDGGCWDDDVAAQQHGRAELAELNRLWATPTGRKILGLEERVAQSAPPSCPRTLFADDRWLAKQRLWWRGKPETRDRALLSLLGGNFPRLTQAVGSYAVADIIGLEVEAIGRQLTRAGIER